LSGFWDKVDAFLEWASTPRHQYGARVARVGLGLVMLYIYSANFAQRHYLFGPNAVYVSKGAFNPFGSVSPAMFDFLYVLAMVAAFAFVMGLGGRLVTLLNFVLFWGWTNAALLIGDGGDNVLRIMLFYLLFADLHGSLKPNEPSTWRKVLGIAHNLALVAVGIQLSALYLTAGMQKVHGDMWRDGTALWYILQVREFSHPVVGQFLLSMPAFTIVFTHLTVFFQIAFPWLIVHPTLRRYAVAIGAAMHLGILAAMNIVSFSLIMIFLDLMMIPDADYIRLGKRIEAVAAAFNRLRQGWAVRPSVAEAERSS